MMKLLFYINLMYLCIYYLNLNIIMMFMSNNLFLLFLMMMLIFNVKNGWFGIYNFFVLDYYSFSLILLTIFIFMLGLMVKINFNKYIYLNLMLFLMMVLIMSFMMNNLFMFYLFFEISLIPTFMLIMGWGYQSERIKASMYMFMYTLFSSLPLLLLMFFIYLYNNSLNFLIINNYLFNLNLTMEFMLYFFMIFSFLVKLPMFFFHIWLPKAHVEAPVVGSMILAALMLKLGGYGMFRISMVMKNMMKFFNIYMILMGVIGVIFVSLMCLRQFDMKMLVAYSSVVHMSIMVMGMFSMFKCGMMGGLLMMLGHGLCSSALFYLVNVLYSRSKSRMMYLNKGMTNMLPSLSMFWFLFCVINMSAPPSLNLLSELMIFISLLSWSKNLILMLVFMIFISSIYSLYLYSYCQHGKLESSLLKIYSINLSEFLILFMHYLPLNLLILKINYLI